MNSQPYSISEFDLHSQLAEVRRELSMRRIVYPKLVGRQQLTQDEADRQMTALLAVAQTLTGLLAAGAADKQPKLNLTQE